VLRLNALTVVAPAPWHLAHQLLNDCVSPKQVLAFTDSTRPFVPGSKVPRERALVVLLEDDGYVGAGFPARRPFRVPERLDQMGGCCEMPFGRGAEFTFRDHGRNLYAFVYAADRRDAARAVGVLNTLRVS
jgi:hypothetical protein